MCLISISEKIVHDDDEHVLFMAREILEMMMIVLGNGFLVPIGHAKPFPYTMLNRGLRRARVATWLVACHPHAARQILIWIAIVFEPWLGGFSHVSFNFPSHVHICSSCIFIFFLHLHKFIINRKLIQKICGFFLLCHIFCLEFYGYYFVNCAWLYN